MSGLQFFHIFLLPAWLFWQENVSQWVNCRFSSCKNRTPDEALLYAEGVAVKKVDNSKITANSWRISWQQYASQHLILKRVRLFLRRLLETLTFVKINEQGV